MSSMITLTPDMIAKINHIGRLRAPVEACGIILPRPRIGQSTESQVVELPNRSLEPDAYTMAKSDILLELHPHLEDKAYVESIAAWHTHPKGGVGPSRSDMQKRIDGWYYLVVALQPDGSAIPSWF